VAAELTPCWKRCNGVMAELAPRLKVSEQTLKIVLP
jgi:hypothetical protein